MNVIFQWNKPSISGRRQLSAETAALRALHSEPILTTGYDTLLITFLSDRPTGIKIIAKIEEYQSGLFIGVIESSQKKLNFKFLAA